MDAPESQPAAAQPDDETLQFAIEPGTTITIPQDGRLEIWSRYPVRLVLTNTHSKPAKE